MTKPLFFTILGTLAIGAVASSPDVGNVSVCFTPADHQETTSCTDRIVDRINSAHNTILVQAYSFTSEPIISALVAAEHRGVVVQVILDKSNFGKSRSGLADLKAANIPVFDDSKPAIAHNKVIIIDNQEVLTGSFNFTNAAEKSNAENSIDIHDADIAQLYTNNWISRKNLSEVK